MTRPAAERALAPARSPRPAQPEDEGRALDLAVQSVSAASVFRSSPDRATFYDEEVSTQRIALANAAAAVATALATKRLADAAEAQLLVERRNASALEALVRASSAW